MTPHPIDHPRAPGIEAALRYLKSHEPRPPCILGLAAAGCTLAGVILWIWILILLF